MGGVNQSLPYWKLQNMTAERKSSMPCQLWQGNANRTFVPSIEKLVKLQREYQGLSQEEISENDDTLVFYWNFPNFRKTYSRDTSRER